MFFTLLSERTVVLDKKKHFFLDCCEINLNLKVNATFRAVIIIYIFLPFRTQMGIKKILKIKYFWFDLLKKLLSLETTV